MNTVMAYYNGVSFVPTEPCGVDKGAVVQITIGSKQDIDKRIAEKLQALELINEELRELNRTEPLPPEF
jgi:hypothetical protein